MAQYLKSQSPEELWKASLKPKDPIEQIAADIAALADPQKAATPPGVGGTLDISA